MHDDTIPDELAPETTVEEAKANLKNLPPDGIDHAGVPKAGREHGSPVTSVSGLSPAHVHQAVNMTLQAAVLAYHHASQIHYTQGGERWQGIDSGKKAWRGQFPTEADCSSFATWCLWNGLDHFHHSDTVNGEHWRAGYTGTLLRHGRQVGTPIPGDLIIYGPGWPGEHTAVYTGGGLVVSHGSEGGPYLLPWRYRSDVLSVRRYI